MIWDRGQLNLAVLVVTESNISGHLFLENLGVNHKSEVLQNAALLHLVDVLSQVSLGVWLSDRGDRELAHRLLVLGFNPVFVVFRQAGDFLMSLR